MYRLGCGIHCPFGIEIAVKAFASLNPVDQLNTANFNDPITKLPRK
jgi:hypothetical protein